MRRSFIVAAVAVMLACSGDPPVVPNDDDDDDDNNPPPPPPIIYPLTAGVYVGTMTLQVANNFGQIADVADVQITVGAVADDGSFSGSFVGDQGSRSGVVAGSARMDGGVTFVTWGVVGRKPGLDPTILNDQYPGCNYIIRTPTSFNGTVTLGRIVASTSISSPNCSGGQFPNIYFFTETITFSISATR